MFRMTSPRVIPDACHCLFSINGVSLGAGPLFAFSTLLAPARRRAGTEEALAPAGVMNDWLRRLVGQKVIGSQLTAEHHSQTPRLAPSRTSPSRPFTSPVDPNRLYHQNWH